LEPEGIPNLYPNLCLAFMYFCSTLCVKKPHSLKRYVLFATGLLAGAKNGNAIGNPYAIAVKNAGAQKIDFGYPKILLYPQTPKNIEKLFTLVSQRPACGRQRLFECGV
jgi:hypothetical protein